MINKSKYCGFCQCPKSVWLKNNKPEEFVSDQSVIERVSNSNEICDMQRGYFGDYIDVTECVTEYDISLLVSKTTELIDAGTKVICKGSFLYDDAYCTVDILRKEDKGYSIYKSKSSTTPNHHSYIVEISYQKYILEKCGIDVVSTNVINVNTGYTFSGELDTNQLFKVTNVDELVAEEIVNVEDNISKLKEILEMTTEPNIELNTGCHSPYPCGFWKYCAKRLPTPSVFDLYGTSIQKKIEYYSKDIVTFEDIRNSGEDLGFIQNMQVEHTLNNSPTYIDTKGVKEFLDKLWYPIYFLDFETTQPALPQYKRSRPYQPIPFQYSLHYIEEKGGKVKHKEYIANPNKDPRRQIAKRLCRDIPGDACVLAFNKFFERGRIIDLAKLYPMYRDKLNVIAYNIKDLIDPFNAGFVYNKDMGNSMSIKSILPALYPNDPSLNYDNLVGVQNGNEAMMIYPKMKTMSHRERRQTKKSLLEYCKLDTLAMVKIYEYLLSAVQDI